MCSVTMQDVDQAISSLVEKDGKAVARLLRQIPASDLALAMVQEVEDGDRANDYDFLRGLDGVLNRVVHLQEVAA